MKRIPTLMATKKMMQMAADDTPIKEKYQYREKIIYKQGLYMRSQIQNDILVVAFFLAEHMRTGGRNPAYELFIAQKSGEFITRDRLLDKWLTAKLDTLCWPTYVGYSEQKWISKSDNTKIKKYLGTQHDGYEGLLRYQLEIRADELDKRHKKETDKWDADLAQVPKLPKDWERWVTKVGIQQNYIFYQYNRKGVDTGYCTYCEKDVRIKQPRHNMRGRCSNCHRDITFKSVGKARIVITKTETMYLIQRCKDGFVIREFNGNRRYRKEKYTSPETECREIRRVIYNKERLNTRAYFWGDYKRREIRWIPSCLCGASWSGDTEGKIYGKTLPDLSKNELSRTGLTEIISNNALIDPEKYLAVLHEFPQVEQLAKAGLPCLANECVASYYNFKNKLFDLKTNNLTKMLGINSQELKRLRQNNGGWRFLDWLKYEKITGKIIPDYVILWLCTEQISSEDLQFILGRMSVVQVYNYVRRQMIANKKAGKDILTTWSDYLSMAKRLQMDIDDEIIFRVNKLFQRHDELIERCHDKDFAIRAGEILGKYPHVDEICKSLKEKYEYGDEDYTVIAPTCIEDIMLEGRSLSHCAATSDRYWERIERQETFILFLRRTSDVDKSYYTLEVEPNGTVRQKRTMYDRQEADIEDATKFLIKWQKEIAKRLTVDDLKLAEESRQMRCSEYAQLRDEKVIIHTGELAGKLLVDVLLADLMENTA